MNLEVSKCCHVARLPIKWRGQQPPVGKCENDTLPGMTYCAEHAGKEAIVYWIKQLAKKIAELEQGGATC